MRWLVAIGLALVITGCAALNSPWINEKTPKAIRILDALGPGH